MIVTEPPPYPSGTLEYLTFTVIADVELADTLPVKLTIDGKVTWLPCTWQGAESQISVDDRRTWRPTSELSEPPEEAFYRRKIRTDLPVLLESPEGLTSIPVLIQVTAAPEVPIIRAGHIDVLAT